MPEFDHRQIALYVHLPWCIKKCPYCDFNSHQRRDDMDEMAYVAALLNDLDFELMRLDSVRKISSIFIGGGTPSLFSADAIDCLLSGIVKRMSLTNDVEITLEANPGASDEARFMGYRQAGVNRLSIGIQSFNAAHLKALGRVHDVEQAISAPQMAKSAGFENFNIDIMYGLPGQSAAQGESDIKQAIALSPSHISAYQLTIEPNTLFAHQPPTLPTESTAWDIQQIVWKTLSDHQYTQYEISAYASGDNQSAHNLNYWRFGDYLGIGAGAHGKMSQHKAVYRTVKPRHPAQYLAAFANSKLQLDEFIRKIKPEDLPLEFMMNQLRLNEGFQIAHFTSVTGLNEKTIAVPLKKAVIQGLLIEENGNYSTSDKGKLFLDDILQLFLPAENLQQPSQELNQCFG